MVTLVDPGRGLWPLIWANVPEGVPATVQDLPWMRAARRSDTGQQVFPAGVHRLVAFFGMPRRLRLVSGEGGIAGVVQRPYGANYADWLHPLSPYYRVKGKPELLPRHPRAGAFGYRNWLGVVARRKSDDDMARRAEVVELWPTRSRERAEVIVAGWAMDNMKPRDFTFSRAPLIDLPPDLTGRMEGMVEAAEAYGVVLRAALAPVLAEGEAREAARETYYLRTQPAFEARLAMMSADPEASARGWLADLRAVALGMFDTLALPGLSERDTRDQADIVQARRNMTAAFAGYGKLGGQAYQLLALPVPEQKRRKAA